MYKKRHPLLNYHIKNLFWSHLEKFFIIIIIFIIRINQQ